MMERKRALTIPFSPDKKKSMENPLRIPTSYLKCENVKEQVPWTIIADHKSRRHDSRHKNGAVMFDHNHAALVRLGLAERKPRLILTDVLKTDLGKIHVEKMKQRLNGKERRSRSKDPPVVLKNRLSNQTKNTNLKAKVESPKIKQTPDSSGKRLSQRSLKKPQSEEKDDGKREQNDVKSTENGRVELVDCGLSVSWEQDESQLPENKANKTLKSPKKTIPQKRKTPDGISESTGTDDTKRPRASVLRLSGAVDKDEVDVHPEIETDEKTSKTTESVIVQFTVGGNDANTDPASPVPKNNEATTDKAEPIVLSSDEEDNNDNFKILKRVSVKPPQQKPNAEEDVQVFQLIVNSNSGSMKETSICLAFTSLYCGAYQAKANGDILITDENIIIPLKDLSEEMDLMLTLERKQLKRYSVWEKYELESLKYFSGRKKAALPAVGLLLCVSEAAADGVHYDLTELCDKQDSFLSTGKPSPFMLIFLENPLEGMEGAFLRSLLDIDCLGSLTREQSTDEYDRYVAGPVLSMEESCELIKSSGLDPHLLQFLEENGDGSIGDNGQESASTNGLDTETSKATALESDDKPLCEKPLEEADQPKDNSNIFSEQKSLVEPAYTVCHQQLNDSYSITMCKTDSSWVKYKHQGLTRRLIQFPPPPMKGGITVTMEDLQCLDFGQYLNDVIIDFYLKYLLQNAPETVAQRSHIFSSFFYKQLTRRDNVSEGSNSESCQRQKRYQRVRTWTRHVDIFSKDFIFVPVNQEAHWYLVIICFPGLEEPKTESLSPESENQDEVPQSPNDDDVDKNETPETDLSSAKEDASKDPGTGSVNCTEKTCQRKTICKKPCIIVMDSLKRSAHERVFKLMREYLQSEWEARRGSERDFGPDQMESSNCQVPLQDNSSDCGLYTLHYVESFLKDPVVHFDLPLQLKFWFPRRQVRRKREEIRDLVLKLYRIQNLDFKR